MQLEVDRAGVGDVMGLWGLLASAALAPGWQQTRECASSGHTVNYSSWRSANVIEQIQEDTSTLCATFLLLSQVTRIGRARVQWTFAAVHGWRGSKR
jgi:hypothetical protein